MLSSRYFSSCISARLQWGLWYQPKDRNRVLGCYCHVYRQQMQFTVNLQVIEAEQIFL